MPKQAIASSFKPIFPASQVFTFIRKPSHKVAIDFMVKHEPFSSWAPPLAQPDSTYLPPIVNHYTRQQVVSAMNKRVLGFNDEEIAK